MDSDTEAVAGKGFKLGCISCKRRSEVRGEATVEWYFRPKGEADFFLVSVSMKWDLWPCRSGFPPSFLKKKHLLEEGTKYRSNLLLYLYKINTVQYIFRGDDSRNMIVELHSFSV